MIKILAPQQKKLVKTTGQKSGKYSWTYTLIAELTVSPGEVKW